MIRVFRLGVVVLLVLLAAACAESSDSTVTETDQAKNTGGYVDITVQELDDMLADKDFTLVNVHIPFEGDIPQTDLSIPYNEIADNLDQLPGKDAAIVLYCRSGNMSTQAAEILANLGYTNVMELDGGFNAWNAAGYTLVGE